MTEKIDRSQKVFYKNTKELEKAQKRSKVEKEFFLIILTYSDKHSEKTKTYEKA